MPSLWIKQESCLLQAGNWIFSTVILCLPVSKTVRNSQFKPTWQTSRQKQSSCLPRLCLSLTFFVCLFFMTLTVLKSSSQVLWRIFLNWNLTFFLRLDRNYRCLEGRPQRDNAILLLSYQSDLSLLVLTFFRFFQVSALQSSLFLPFNAVPFEGKSLCAACTSGMRNDGFSHFLSVTQQCWIIWFLNHL